MKPPKIYRNKCRYVIRPVKRMIVLVGRRDDGTRYDDYRIVTDAWIRRHVACPECFGVKSFERKF